jgi:hypothetical protein
MQFVFVSHANVDKPLIRPIVDALIKSKLKVWLDNPAAMGFSAKEIKADFYHIKTGGEWLSAIRDGVRDAGAVLA